MMTFLYSEKEKIEQNFSRRARDEHTDTSFARGALAKSFGGSSRGRTSKLLFARRIWSVLVNGIDGRSSQLVIYLPLE